MKNTSNSLGLLSSCSVISTRRRKSLQLGFAPRGSRGKRKLAPSHKCFAQQFASLIIDASLLKDGCIAASLYLASDGIAQKSEGPGGLFTLSHFYYYSTRRGLRYTSFGFLDGCFSHLWFAKLDDAVHLDGLFFSGSKSIILAEASAKTALDFICFTPWWCASFLFYMALLSGNPLQAAIQRVKKEWRELYTGNVLAWLPANFVIYFFLPLELRVLGFGTYNLMYTAILSIWAEQHSSNTGAAEEKEEKAKTDRESQRRREMENDNAKAKKEVV